MKWLERIHEGGVYGRRVRVLADSLAPLFSDGARVLDVGCGDGRVATAIGKRRDDLAMEGVDVLVRPGTPLPVRAFDGRTIPFPDGSFDDVLFVDVIHHAEDPSRLLDEAVRVARRAIVVKDHLREGFLADATLRFMDRVGNERYGVALPYNYWTRAEWEAEFAIRRLRTVARRDRLGLYPGPANWVFGRGLHFTARLEVP